MDHDRRTADRIAKSALKILEAEGPSAVSMRRVAAAAGITAMAIYHHFSNRDQLLRAVTDGEFETLLRYIQARNSRADGDVRPKDLVELMEGYIDYAIARPRVFDYVFLQGRKDARRYPEDFRARKSPTLNVVADAVSGCMRSGKLRKDDVWDVAFELWALVHGYVALYRAGRIDLSEKKFRALCRRSLERLIDGLRL